MELRPHPRPGDEIVGQAVLHRHRPGRRRRHVDAARAVNTSLGRFAGGPRRLLKELVPGDHVTLVKNPAYHKPGLPYLDTLEFRVMKDPLTASTALRTGQIDLISRVPIQLVKV